MTLISFLGDPPEDDPPKKHPERHIPQLPYSHRGEFTSQAAARSSALNMDTLREQVYALVQERGTLTPWEAITALEMDAGLIYVVRPRFTELGIDRLIVKTHNTRRGGPYKKYERVWTLWQAPDSLLRVEIGS